MAFTEKIKQFVTGKNQLERQQEAAATKQIRSEVNAATFRQKRESAIKFAQESEKLKFERKLSELKKPRPSMNSFNFISPRQTSFDSITGTQRTTPAVKSVRRKVSRGGKGRSVSRSGRTVIITRQVVNPIRRRQRSSPIRRRQRVTTVPQKQERFNPIGGFFENR